MSIKPFLSGMTGLLALSTASQALAFTWKSEGASATGSGCNSLPNGVPVDVSFLSNGPDISIVFTSLGIELTDPSQGLSAQKNCNMRIPFLLDEGSYEGQLSESVTVGLTKTEGSDATLDFKSRVLDSLRGAGGAGQFNPMRNRFNRGAAMNQPLMIKSRETMLGQDGGRRCQFARNAANSGAPFYYDAQLALAATRQDLNQQVILQADAVDVRLELSQKLQPCSGGFPGGGHGGPGRPGPGGPGGPGAPGGGGFPQPRPIPTPPVVVPVPTYSTCSSPLVQITGARGGTGGMGNPGERLFGYYNAPQLAGAVDFQVVYNEYSSYDNVDPYNLQLHVSNQSLQLALGNSASQWIALQPGTTQFALSTLINQRPNNNAASQNFIINVRFAYHKLGPCP